MIAAVTHRHTLAGRVLGNPLFLWVGTRSYGLYLYHWPIYQIIRKDRRQPADVAAVRGRDGGRRSSITELSYRYVEMPIRKGVVGVWWRGLRRARDPVPRQLVTSPFGRASLLLDRRRDPPRPAPICSRTRSRQSIDEGAEATTDRRVTVDGPDGAAPAPTRTAPPTGTTVRRATGSVAPADQTTTTHDHDDHDAAADRAGRLPGDRRLGDARRGRRRSPTGAYSSTPPSSRQMIDMVPVVRAASRGGAVRRRRRHPPRHQRAVRARTRSTPSWRR